MMQLLLTFLVVLHVIVAPMSVLCQNPYVQPFDSARVYFARATATEAASCAAPGVSATVSPAYAAGFTYTSSSACVQPHETLCRAPSGAVRCQNHDAKVVSTKRSNKTLYPALGAQGTEALQQCVSEGVYQHPEANAVLVAQCVVSFIVIIICAVLTLIRTWQYSSPFVRYWFLFMMIVCMLLLPSFYYLNGLIGVGAAMIAVIMFSTRNSTAVAIGITACIAAVMWFTFDSGLGFLTHTAHLTPSVAGDPMFPLYETMCNGYYRYSYYVPLSVRGDDTNPLEITERACLRGWLSTELFFSVFLILSLIILAVGGAHALTHGHVDSEAEATKPSSA